MQAIANESERHIINVNLSNVKTKTQLHSLFFDEDIRVAPDQTQGPGADDIYNIPINKRLFVLEVRLHPLAHGAWMGHDTLSCLAQNEVHEHVPGDLGAREPPGIGACSPCEVHVRRRRPPGAGPSQNEADVL